MNTVLSIAGVALVALAAAGFATTPSSEGAEVYIIAPDDGAVVSSPVQIVFGLKGMGVAPAGVERAGTGHHHLLVDRVLPEFGQPIPADVRTIHFGGGQTETSVELAPGEHTLQLLLGDYLHIPHEPPVYSEKITITVTQ